MTVLLIDKDLTCAKRFWVPSEKGSENKTYKVEVGEVCHPVRLERVCRCIKTLKLE